MKLKRRSIFTVALNVSTTAINAIAGAFHELALPEGETTLRFCLCRYGEYPVTDVTGKDIIQVVDRQAAQTVAANFRSLYGKFATFFRGVPMFEGHADDSEWLQKHPGHRASAVARIKAVDAEDDGIYVTAALNSDGVGLLGGDAPKYTGQSPLWRLSKIPDRPGCFSPVLLWSVALTNNPNIMTNTIALNSLLGVADADPSPSAESGQPEKPETTTDMKLTVAALAALGFAPDAEPTTDEISAAIVKMFSDKESAATNPATAQTETTAANSRLTIVQAELDEIRSHACDVLLDGAVASGRITEADKSKWATALNTSFKSEAEKLAALMPVVNTTNHVGSLDRRQGVMDATTTDALNTAVRALATEHNLNLEDRKDYDRAWAMLRTAKPELFERK